jgi:hypothetical protein
MLKKIVIRTLLSKFVQYCINVYIHIYILTKAFYWVITNLNGKKLNALKEPAFKYNNI